MTVLSATSAAPLPFAAHIDAPMPRVLRQQADAMSFEAFHDEYASSSGPLRLGNWRYRPTADIHAVHGESNALRWSAQQQVPQHAWLHGELQIHQLQQSFS